MQLLQYFTDVKEEMKKVQWPSKSDTKRLTVYVIGVSLSVGSIVFGLDYVFKKGLELILVR